MKTIKKAAILRLITFASIIVSLATIFSGCSFGSGGKFEYNIDNEPKNMDPQIASDSASLIVISNVFEGLMKLDENNNLTCGIAQSYAVSEDSLEYFFKIREDARWSNEQPITAEDFVFAFRRIFLKETESPGVKLFSSIENAEQILNGTLNVEQLGVRAIAHDTVAFKLNQEDSSFLSSLTAPSAMPCNEKFFSQTKGRYGLERTTLIYSGPFKISSWVHDSFVYLTQNNGYVTEKVNAESVNFTIVKEYEKRLENFKNGDSSAMKIEFSDVQSLDKSQISTEIYDDTVWAFGFNLKDETFKSPELRKALTFSFDKSAYRNNLNEYFKTTDTIIPSALTVGKEKYYDLFPSNLAHKLDVSQARNEYNKYLSNQQIERLSGATILVPQDSHHRYNISYIQQIWQRDLGIFINLEVLPQEEIIDRMEKGNFQMAIFPIKAEIDNLGNIFSGFLSGNSKNYFGYSNPQYDQLFSMAEKEKNNKEAAKLFSQCETIIGKSNFIIPMYFQSSIYAYSSSIKAIEFSPFGNIIRFSSAKK